MGGVQTGNGPERKPETRREDVSVAMPCESLPPVRPSVKERLSLDSPRGDEDGPHPLILIVEPIG